jgi:hypothetical protein
LSGKDHPIQRDDRLVFVFAAAYVGSDIGEILAGEHRYNAWHRFRFGRIDATNARVRVGLRKNFPSIIPGTIRSPVYFARPVTLSTPSTRGIDRPTTENFRIFSLTAAPFGPSQNAIVPRVTNIPV